MASIFLLDLPIATPYAMFARRSRERPRRFGR
jgi:hypothetical protein